MSMMLPFHFLGAALQPGSEPLLFGLAFGMSKDLAIAVGAITVLFVLIVGGYAAWRRRLGQRRQQNLAAAIEAQASLAPKTLSDPNQRAALDKMRQKFQAGLHEFQSRGKDIFRLPWYMIIGEPGSGKTEAIRHSGIEFPSGLQNELQGSGGTVNMDWWFTNQGIILDTAGRLVFNDAPPSEAPEWGEFLRLLKKTRFHCPINGLFIVLSIESLIRDSSEEITQKARRLAQQLDLIQRTLDVRFPVYLLVTKSDLLAGFREFFGSIDDPHLCHQMFGWSNPEPLDSRFRPDLVGEHLTSIAQRLRRRRMALLRESLARRLGSSADLSPTVGSPGEASSVSSPADNIESMFALPESILRLRPRLHRYLETIFTAGEWSPKPLFLRGIYFTSSMTEGKALDEAIAFATGLDLDQLPGDETRAKDRAYFLRDLFLEKVFRESGLVTRATNTMALLRRRRFAILGAASFAALLFLSFSGFGYGKLKKSVLEEAEYWKLGATHLAQGSWSPPIISALDDTHELYAYGGTNHVPASGQPTLVEYHARLQTLAQQDLAGEWIFRPISWVVPGGVTARPIAQRVLFESWILDPIVQAVRAKLLHANPAVDRPESLARLREAIVAIALLEQDPASTAPRSVPADVLQALLSYLTERELKNDGDLEKLTDSVYSELALSRSVGTWPPASLSGGNTLASNQALATGLKTFGAGAAAVDKRVLQQLTSLNQWVDKLQAFAKAEQDWLANPSADCTGLNQTLMTAKFDLDGAATSLRSLTNAAPGGWRKPGLLYASLAGTASNAAPASIIDRVRAASETAGGVRLKSLAQEIQDLLSGYLCKAAAEVQTSADQRRRLLPSLERDELGAASARPEWELRWNLYSEACLLDAPRAEFKVQDLGNAWQVLADWTNRVGRFEADLMQYSGPFNDSVRNSCGRILLRAESNTQRKLADNYAQVALSKLTELGRPLQGSTDLPDRRSWYARIEQDFATASALGEQVRALAPTKEALIRSKLSNLVSLPEILRQQFAFPLVLSAAQTIDAQGWAAAWEALTGATNELANPVWKSDPSLAEPNDQAQRLVRKFLTRLESLSDRERKVVQAEISAVPYEQLSPRDKDVVKIFRYARVEGAPASEVEDLTRPKRPLATKPLAEKMKLLLQASGSLAYSVELPAWWLLRDLRDGRAEALEDGASWRIRVPVADPASKVNGQLLLKVRLLGTAHPLKREDWVE